MIVTNADFRNVYAKWSKNVFGAAYCCLLNQDAANDVLQQTFVKLLECRINFEDDEVLKLWLMETCMEVCEKYLDSIKSQKKEVPRPDNYYDIKDAQQERVLGAIFRLPVKYRVPVHLSYCEDYETWEIAKVTKTLPPVAANNLKKGRDELRKMLRGEEWIC